MKPKKSLFKRMVLGVILAVVAMVNVFGIGFSTFMVFGDSTANVGNIDVNVGDIAFIDIDKNNANSPDKNGISSFTCTYDGFTESGSSLPTSKVVLYFNATINTQKGFNFNFSFKQINATNEYANYDFTRFISKMTLSAVVKGQTNSKTNTLVRENHGDKIVDSTFSIKDVGALGNGVVVPMSIEFYIDASSVDFASEVFYPMYWNKCTFEIGIKVNE